MDKSEGEEANGDHWLLDELPETRIQLIGLEFVYKQNNEFLMGTINDENGFAGAILLEQLRRAGYLESKINPDGKVGVQYTVTLAGKERIMELRALNAAVVMEQRKE